MPTGGRFLLARNRIQAALRGCFEERDFVEVETAALQVSPGNEAHLHAFATELGRPAATRAPLYLHTSPEFACKKLLAAGERRIFDFARVFRNRERGALHHPEFTHARMVSGGRALRGADAGLRASFWRSPPRPPARRSLRYRGREADPFAEPERLTVAEAFERFAGIDLLATLADGGEPDLATARRRRRSGRHPRRRGRHLVRRLQPRARRAHRAESRASAAPRS